MASIDEHIEEFESSGDMHFVRLVAVRVEHFGPPRVAGSHHVFKTPWPGDPRINLQKAKGGKAKPYQVRQVLAALRKLRAMQDEDGDEE